MPLKLFSSETSPTEYTTEEQEEEDSKDEEYLRDGDWYLSVWGRIKLIHSFQTDIITTIMFFKKSLYK